MIIVFQTSAGIWMMGEAAFKRSPNGGSVETEIQYVKVKNPRLVRYSKGGVQGCISAQFEHIDAVNKPEVIYTVIATWFTPSKDFLDQYKEAIDEKIVSIGFSENSESSEPPQHHSQVS